MRARIAYVRWAAAAVLVALPGARAQGLANVGRPLLGVNPYFQVSPGLSVAQAAYNARTLGPIAFNPYFMNGVVPPVPRTVIGNPFLNPGMTNPGLTGNPYAAGMTGAGYGTSYSSGNGSYGETEIGGFLRGTADVVNSTGRFLTSRQQANLLSEQVQKERIENRRRLFDQWLYEREKGPTWEDERQRSVKQWTSRSLNDPPTGEIWSGTALNLILADIQKKAAKEKGVRGPSVPLDEDVLSRVNLSSRPDSNAGLLKNKGRLDWPLALRSEEFQADRQLLSDLVPEAINQAVNGSVDAGTLKGVMAAAGHMRAGLRGQVGDLPPGQYMAASRFLANFNDAVRVLQQPDAGDYFTRKYAAKGKDVAELVKYMTERGLRFAPAVDGDEAAYTALHRALAAYDAGVTAIYAER